MPIIHGDQTIKGLAPRPQELADATGRRVGYWNTLRAAIDTITSRVGARLPAFTNGVTLNLQGSRMIGGSSLRCTPAIRGHISIPGVSILVVEYRPTPEQRRLTHLGDYYGGQKSPTVNAAQLGGGRAHTARACRRATHAPVTQPSRAIWVVFRTGPWPGRHAKTATRSPLPHRGGNACANPEQTRVTGHARQTPFQPMQLEA
jgi:hypothetical protein